MKKVILLLSLTILVACSTESSSDPSEQTTPTELDDLPVPTDKPEATKPAPPKKPVTVSVDKPKPVVKKPEGPDEAIITETGKLPYEKKPRKLKPGIIESPTVKDDKKTEELIKTKKSDADDSLLELSKADMANLERSFKISPKVVEHKTQVLFSISAIGKDKWKWDYDLDGDGIWDGGRETLNAYKYDELGLKKVRIRAKSKNFTKVFEQEIEISVSEKFLKKLFADLKILAKAGKEDQVINKLKDLENVLHPNFLIRVPGEIPIKEFPLFEDIAIADLPAIEVYTHLVNFKTDRSTGLVKSITLK